MLWGQQVKDMQTHKSCMSESCRMASARELSVWVSFSCRSALTLVCSSATASSQNFQVYRIDARLDNRFASLFSRSIFLCRSLASSARVSAYFSNVSNWCFHCRR